jgi:hypothetical protein
MAKIRPTGIKFIAPVLGENSHANRGATTVTNIKLQIKLLG